MDRRYVKRQQIIEELVQRILQVEPIHPVRVAIDGVDAAGKTMLAEELVDPIQKRGRPVIRASIDGFHNPAQRRHHRGVTSPEGYYHDSFNYQALIASLLAPLGPSGSRQYRTKVFDYRSDAELQEPLRLAENDAVLIFDGVFLLRHELQPHWDLTIFVDTAFEVTLARAQQRDVSLFGNVAEVTRRYEQRYIPGQKLYLAECRPKDRANVVIDNNDLSHPVLL
jgi:uridine kinase